MFDLGFQELIVIFIVALLVFGPNKLPELGRTIGKGIREVKKAMGTVKYEVDKELYDAQTALKEPKKPPEPPINEGQKEENKLDEQDADAPR